MKGILLVFLVILAFLTACVGPTTQRVKVSDIDVMQEAERQRAAVIQSDQEMNWRLARVTYLLATKGVSFCGKQIGKWPGVNVISRTMYSKEYAPVVDRMYKLGPELRVQFVVPGGAGDSAGLMAGDRYLQVDGAVVPPDAGPEWLARNYESWRNKSDYEIVTLRNGVVQTIKISPAVGCNYGVRLMEGDQINAFADGKSIFVTRGMMRFAQSDTELALVISHELAHNFMRHTEAKASNQVLGTLADKLISLVGVNTDGKFGRSAAQTYSQEFESEADYEGLYVMAIAGMDYREAPKFWRRMAVAKPAEIDGGQGAPYPSTAYRLKALEAAVSEIDLKKQAGTELRPNLKSVAARRTERDGTAPPSGDSIGPGRTFKSRDFSKAKGNGPAPGDQ